METAFMRLASVRSVVVLGLALCCGASTTAADVKLTVTAGAHDRRMTPVLVDLPAETPASGGLQLVSGEGESLLLQRLGSNQAVFVLAPLLKAGESRTYTLQPGPVAAEPACSAQVTDHFIELTVRGKPVLRYNTAVVMPPEGADPAYARSGHIHPVWSPGGAIVTSEFPADHMHQHGIFNAWVNTSFEGRKVDFWNQAGKTGHIEHAAVVGTRSCEVFCEFTVELRHSDLTAPGGPKPVLKELWTVRAWNAEGGNLFDIESRQTCVAETPLTLNEYHYGGMALRGASRSWGTPATSVTPSRCGCTRASRISCSRRRCWASIHWNRGSSTSRGIAMSSRTERPT
jgi:hypothetical protein